MRLEKMNRWMGTIATVALLAAGTMLALPGCKDKADAGSTSVSQPAGETEQYTCPMHPQVRQDEPGKCPDCGMDLVKEGEEHMHH